MRGVRRSAGLLSIALLTAACGSAHPGQAFHPTGASQSAPVAAAPAPGQPAAGGLTWPPFGHQVQIIMPGWTPSRASEAPAVLANKNFLLALLYAEYRGNQDTRWRAYTASRLRPALQAQLSQPDVTTQSFTGTIRFSHMTAFPDPAIKGAIDVAQCFDNSHSTNTSLHTGRPVPDNTPADQHYYRTTNVLARSHGGSWQVVSMYSPIYYPRAPECKP
jgi:hypothetical protein